MKTSLYDGRHRPINFDTREIHMMRERGREHFHRRALGPSCFSSTKTTKNEQLKSYRSDSRSRRSDVSPKSDIRREIALQPLRESSRVRDMRHEVTVN